MKYWFKLEQSNKFAIVVALVLLCVELTVIQAWGVQDQAAILGIWCTLWVLVRSFFPGLSVLRILASVLGGILITAVVMGILSGRFQAGLPGLPIDISMLGAAVAACLIELALGIALICFGFRHSKASELKQI